MKLFEYQGKILFSKCGLITPVGYVVDKYEQLQGLSNSIKYPVMVKAQILSGGRGKAGGVIKANDEQSLSVAVKKLLGSELKGNQITSVLVEQCVPFVEEYYVSITMDSRTRMPMIMFSACGGMEIEQIAATSPEKIAKVIVDPLTGIQAFHVDTICKIVGISDPMIKKQLKKTIPSLYKVYENYDAMVVEINPLMRLEDNTLIAADSKVEIDDSAVSRHPEILDWHNDLLADPLVKMAKDAHLLYIDVDSEGTIGVISNGSGMVMSCVDRIVREGGKVACAMDLGGGATADKVANAIHVILKNKHLKILVISIFGGITRCNEIAEGILKAVETQDITVPIVVKLDGTNKEEGGEILKSAGNPKVQIAADLNGVATKVMSLQV